MVGESVVGVGVVGVRVVGAIVVGARMGSIAIGFAGGLGVLLLGARHSGRHALDMPRLPSPAGRGGVVVDATPVPVPPGWRHARERGRRSRALRWHGRFCENRGGNET